MAQILKDELRDKIIESAKSEFLAKGYNGASMRSIAQKAGMTVGNLYRYFKNKEDINAQIVGTTIQSIDEILKDLTSDNVSMETRVFNIKANVSELSDLLDQLSDRLVDTYNDHPTEFNILMMHSNLNKELTAWFSHAINSLIEQHFLLQGHHEEKNILANAYAVSIFSGIQEIFKNNNVDQETLKRVVSTYLHSYIVLLESDIHRLVD